MSMEQRITTLEEVSRLVIAALRESNEAMQRYNEAMRRAEVSMSRYEESMRQYEIAAARRDEAIREAAAAAERLDAAVQALLAFVPVTQAEIVRLDSRIDRIEGE